MRGLRAGALAFGMLMLTMPVAAQDEATPVAAQEATPVAFGAIGFTVPMALGEGVDVSVTPGDPPVTETLGIPQPPAVVFTIHAGRGEGERLPRVGEGDTVVRAYRIADLAPYAGAMEQVDALQAILDEHADLRPFATPGAEPLPVLPIGDLGQVLRVRPIYIDTPTVSGIRYLAAYEQPGDGGPLDRFPLRSDSLVDTFQGISADGAWYVSVMQQLDTSLFPDQPTPQEIDRANRRWDTYLAESISKLKSAARDDFTPSLDVVDALLASLNVADPAASE